MLKRIGFIVLLTALSGAASAGGGETCKYFFFLPYDCAPTSSGGGGGGRNYTVAPEIDLGTTGAALTLALGGLAVLRARRVRNLK